MIQTVSSHLRRGLDSCYSHTQAHSSRNLLRRDSCRRHASGWTVFLATTFLSFSFGKSSNAQTSQYKRLFGLADDPLVSSNVVNTPRTIESVIKNRSWYFSVDSENRTEKKEKHLKSRQSSKKKSKDKKMKTTYCMHSRITYKGGEGNREEPTDDDALDKVLCDEKSIKRHKTEKGTREPDYGDYETANPSATSSPSVILPIDSPVASPIIDTPISPTAQKPPFSSPPQPSTSVPSSGPITSPINTAPNDGAQVLPPSLSPISAPLDTPASDPVSTPVSSPFGTPGSTPVMNPVSGSVDAPGTVPVNSPTAAPIDQPRAPIADGPIRSPTTPPGTSPVSSPVSLPSAAPIGLPVLAPLDGPIASPTKAPVPTPMVAPITSPMGNPADAPSSLAPVSSPVISPVSAPPSSPVTAPNTSPINSPVTGPTDSPVDTPVLAPVTSPMLSPSPGAAPAAAPTALPQATPQTLAPASSPVEVPISGPPVDVPFDSAAPVGVPVVSPSQPRTDSPVAPPATLSFSPTVDIVAATPSPTIAKSQPITPPVDVVIEVPTKQPVVVATLAPTKTVQTSAPMQVQLNTVSPTVTLYRRSTPFEIVFGLPAAGGDSDDGLGGDFSEAQVAVLEFLESYFETVFADRQDVSFSDLNGEVLESDPSIPSASFIIEIFLEPGSAYSPTVQEIDILTEVSTFEEPFVSSFLGKFAQLDPDNPYSKVHTLEYIGRPDLTPDDRGGTKAGAKTAEVASLSVTPFRLSFIGTGTNELSHEATKAVIRTALSYLDEYLSMTFDAVEKNVYNHLTGDGKSSGNGLIGFIVTLYVASGFDRGYSRQEIDSAVEMAFSLPAIEALVISLHALSPKNPYSSVTKIEFLFIPDFQSDKIPLNSTFTSAAMIASITMFGLCSVATMSLLASTFRRKSCQKPQSVRKERLVAVHGDFESKSQTFASVEMRVPLGQKHGGEEVFDLSIDSGCDPLIWWSGSSEKS